MIKSICIYCGSANQVDQKFRDSTEIVTRALVKRDTHIVYGGGTVGLMGVMANAAIAAGGRVTGIIPSTIVGERRAHNLTELIEVPDMHTRKRLMAERADAFLILPGGLGTLDEAFEIMTWKQLGMHRKRVLIYNMHGFWQPLLSLIDHIIAQKFAPLSNKTMYSVVSSVPELLLALEQPDDKPLDPSDKWK